MIHVFEALEANASVKYLKTTVRELFTINSSSIDNTQWHLSIAETAALSKLIEKNTLLSLDATVTYSSMIQSSSLHY